MNAKTLHAKFTGAMLLLAVTLSGACSQADDRKEPVTTTINTNGGSTVVESAPAADTKSRDAASTLR